MGEQKGPLPVDKQVKPKPEVLESLLGTQMARRRRRLWTASQPRPFPEEHRSLGRNSRTPHPLPRAEQVAVSGQGARAS